MGRQAKLKSKSRTPTPVPAAERVPAPSSSPWATGGDGQILLLLVILTLAVFIRVAGHDFITLDDPLYVTGNEVVQRGLTLQGIRYAFTTFDTGNWIPLTWLSLMLDVSLFGVRAGGMALVNVLLHVASAVVLFLTLRRMTSSPWPSAFVAAVFAVHPAHVESVAWISERKDVLSSLFAFLTLLFYERYARTGRRGAYLAMLAMFTLGLLAKPMLVTIPFVLLLLDHWPLRRFDRAAAGRLLLEKLPLFALAAASSVIALVAQRAGGAVASAQSLPLVTRAENAIVSYMNYVGMLALPSRLSVFYPYQYTITTFQLASSLVFLLALTLAAAVYWKRFPWLFTGWFWFGGMLVPVIGLIQVGTQSMADRYTYLPSIGLFIIAAWGAAVLAARLRTPVAGVGVVGFSVVLLLAAAAFQQVGLWRNSVTLFSHALQVTRDNGFAHYNLGLAYQQQGQMAAATNQFREALAATLRTTPTAGRERAYLPSWYGPAQNAIAADLIEQAKAAAAAGQPKEAEKRVTEAIARLDQALKLDPHFADAKTNLASAYALAGRNDEAAKLYGTADSYDSHLNLGAVLSRDGKIDEAIAHFRAAAAIQPDKVEPMIYVTLGLAQAGQNREALEELSRAIAKDRTGANDYLTNALRLPPKPTNVDEYAAYLRAQQP